MRLEVIMGTLIAIIIVLAVGSLFFMLLWNYAVTAALSIARPINYWQAVGLIVLIVGLSVGGSSSAKSSS